MGQLQGAAELDKMPRDGLDVMGRSWKFIGFGEGFSDGNMVGNFLHHGKIYVRNIMGNAIVYTLRCHQTWLRYHLNFDDTFVRCFYDYP